jgi:hypothetical protein
MKVTERAKASAPKMALWLRGKILIKVKVLLRNSAILFSRATNLYTRFNRINLPLDTKGNWLRWEEQ